MTRTGRIVAGIGAVMLGLLAVVVLELVVSAFVAGVAFAVIFGVLVCPIFGVVTAAFYTWTVNGAFVLARWHTTSR